ncbi:MAG: RNA polymerase sigma factor [Cytophagales bacterium]|nr:RNA polymerase sigma factor [Cytophagales bacterium]MDW8383295.1 sigma-70 family RNA polymerase sigma factor [Flammeovirgaceae bacterium]
MIRRRYSDVEIIDAIRKGEETSGMIEYLYNKHLPKIVQYIRKNNGTREQAFDIFQDALLSLCIEIKKNRYKQEYELGGFLFQICKNKWINEAKKLQKMLVSDQTPEITYEQTALDIVLSAEKQSMVQQALSQIGEKCQQLLIYSTFHRLSMKEICAKMGFSTENAAKTQNYKCKQKLLEVIKRNPVLYETFSKS